MKKLLIAVGLVGLLAMPAWAHRLDEYLQATILSIESGSVQATLRMVPGVAVAPAVIAAIDSNHDGLLSEEEQRRYAEAVLADLRLQEDGQALPLHLESALFPTTEAMQGGTGEIQIGFSAHLRSASGEHELAFENHHRSDISFDGAFRLGVRHIAEGTDHLLFLLTLLLPAPLLAVAGRWRQRATVRQSILQILRVVTAFTVGHSLTLALSTFGLVRLPERPVEVLIAVSILVSAVHAMRPLFPGREAFVAATFGLVHGLAFASALHELGVTGWYRVVSLLGFNTGIEAMQLMVVAVTLPALVLLGRTPFYAAFRIAGAATAGIASLAWILERVTGQPNTVSEHIERIAHHGGLLVCLLWGVCLLALLMRRSTSAELRGTPSCVPADPLR